jgi:uncharacterized protein
MDSASFQVDEILLSKVRAYVEEYMGHYDASHDFNHIQRVVNLAHSLYASQPASSLSKDIITLSALLHDVGDKKYLKPGEDPSRLVHGVLTSFGAPEPLAEKIQAICLGVSYSSEIKDPERVVQLIAQHPELAIVQDADRLDALGAVGVGRAFAFGGAKNRSLEDSIAHFEEKLVRLEAMMKTDAGKQLARERTERIRMMQAWWQQETAMVIG